jgi:hypothetical protein
MELDGQNLLVESMRATLSGQLQVSTINSELAGLPFFIYEKIRYLPLQNFSLENYHYKLH